MNPASDLAERLGALDTCVVSDALDALSLPGVAAGLRPLSIPRKVAGRAVTVELVPATPEAVAAASRHLATAAVVASGPGDVIVIAHPGGEMAGWGGLLTKAASQRGIEGTIIDGKARDIDESREFGYPVYGRDATPVTARGRIVEKAWGGEVSFAGLTVATGDLVLADGSGVVFLPAAHAPAIIERAEALAARERTMADELDRGTPITEAMGKSYEQLLHRNEPA